MYSVGLHNKLFLYSHLNIKLRDKHIAKSLKGLFLGIRVENCPLKYNLYYKKVKSSNLIGS